MPIRKLTPADAEAFRTLRLEGLRANPESFGAHIDDEEKLPLAEFARRITPSEDAWVLGAFDDQNVLRGTMGWYRERGVKHAHLSMLWGVYVQPSHRRKGYGAALLSALLERVDAVPGLRRVELHAASSFMSGRRTPPQRRCTLGSASGSSRCIPSRCRSTDDSSTKSCGRCRCRESKTADHSARIPTLRMTAPHLS